MGSKYRSANVIIQNILEEIIHAEDRVSHVKTGVVKSHLARRCGLKTSTADKYFAKMQRAGYVTAHEEPWGERTIIVYATTPLGRERYEWFVKINAELEGEA